VTAPATHSTAQSGEPERLSFHRIQRITTAATTATVLTAVGAALAWLVITQWSPATFLPSYAQHGLRFWLLAAISGYALLRTVEAVWDRTHGEARLAAGAATPIPVQPLGRWLGLLSVLLSMPLWDRAITAVQANDASILFTFELAERAALLAAPVLALAVLTNGVIAGVGELRWQLDLRQRTKQSTVEAETPAMVG